jgi:hypothetical protein
MTDLNINLYLQNLGTVLPSNDYEERRICSVILRSEGVFYEIEEKWMGSWDSSSFVHVDTVSF